MKLLNGIKFTFFLILCITLTSCDDDDPIVCNTIAVHGGNEQAGITGEILVDPLQVRVTDGSGQPLSNASVRWEVISGGGSLSTSNSTTNDQGIAETNWTFGQDNGRTRAIIENPSECKTSIVEFKADKIFLNLIASSSKVDPVSMNNERKCYDFNYIIAFSSNADLSGYFIDIEGDYQYENETLPNRYYMTGTVSPDGKSLTFQDCYTFDDNNYIEDWFKVSLYNLDDIINGEPANGAEPVVTSNRIGPIRTNRPADSPRLASGTERPAAPVRSSRR